VGLDEPVRAPHGMELPRMNPLLHRQSGDIEARRKCRGCRRGHCVRLVLSNPAAGNIGSGGSAGRSPAAKNTFFDYPRNGAGQAPRRYIKHDGKLDEPASTIGYRSVARAATVPDGVGMKTHWHLPLAE